MLSLFGNSWIIKENQKGPIFGSLGGIPISIPKPFARFVEYENDPHFLEPRKGEPPKRTFNSSLQIGRASWRGEWRSRW